MNYHIAIYNLLGIKMADLAFGAIGSLNTRIDVSAYNQGIYLVKVLKNDKDIFTKELIILEAN